MKKCCCCSLRTGSTLIAIWDIVSGILIFSLPFISHTLQSSTTKTVVDPRETEGQQNTEWLFNFEKIEESISHLETVQSFWTQSNIITLLYGIICVGLGIILLVGIKKKAERLLLTWIICSAIGIVIFLLKLLFGISALAIISIVSMALQLLFLIVVYYHRKEIQDINSVPIPSVVKPLNRENRE